MAASSGIKRSRPGSLLLVVLLLGRTGAVDPALTVANNLERPLTLVHLPGCCSPCGWVDPPPGLQCYAHGCVRCPNLVLDAAEATTLNKMVGPYPLPFLRIQVEEVVYCVADEDLKLVTASVTLTVGPGKCWPGLQASVSRDAEKAPLATLCLPLCSL